MQIRANAWHLQVFLQAYVHDRFWIDNGVTNPTEECKTPETEAYAAFEKEFYELPPTERYSEENQKRLQDLAKASRKAFTEWRKQQEVIYTTNKSREVSERLFSGRMSLCPYFWSIVSALVFYYGIIRGTRPFRNFFNRIADGLATAVGVMFVLAILGLIGYGIYSIHDQIPTPKEVVVSVKQSVQEYRNDQAIKERLKQEDQEQMQQQAQEHKLWEQQHPEEVQRQRLQEAEEARLQSQQNWEDFKQFAQGLGWMFLGLLGIIAGIAALLGLMYLIGKAGEWLANRYGWGVAKEPKPPGAVQLWLARVWESLEPVRRFYKDTKELIHAFAKAKKERVCPYLQIVNGDQHTQSQQ